MRRAHRRRGQQGAAAVEFALVFPIVLILVFATIQWGLYFWADQGGSDAARNAARLSAVGTPTDCTTFKAQVKAPIDKMGNNFVITRSFTDTDSDGLIEVGDTVTVTVDVRLDRPALPLRAVHQQRHGQLDRQSPGRVRQRRTTSELLMKINLSRRNERGAVAIFLAITVSTVLLITGALAVDLGNAWARGRDVQRQVDVAALSAAPKLPVTTTADRTAAAQAVLDSMKQTNNSVSGQSLTSVTATTLLNNGMITFQHKVAGSWVDCAAGTLCTQMTVNAPDARVQFGLAAVSGHSHVDVTKYAVVRVSTQLPIAKNVMPFWLPNGCSFGPAEPDTTRWSQGWRRRRWRRRGCRYGRRGRRRARSRRVRRGGDRSAVHDRDALADHAGCPGGPAHDRRHRSHDALHPDADRQGRTTSSRNMEPEEPHPGSIRFVSPDGTTVVDAAVSDTDGNKDDYILTTGDFTVPPGVSSIPGAWKVYGMVLEGNGTNETQKYSSNFLTLTVTGTAPRLVGADQHRSDVRLDQQQHGELVHHGHGDGHRHPGRLHRPGPR